MFTWGHRVVALETACPTALIGAWRERSWRELLVAGLAFGVPIAPIGG